MVQIQYEFVLRLSSQDSLTIFIHIVSLTFSSLLKMATCIILTIFLAYTVPKGQTYAHTHTGPRARY
jgi:hypothetical protein